MTKSELIAELAASNPHLRQADVELIVATIFDQITAALALGVGGGENPRINGAESLPESRSSSHRAALGSVGPAAAGNQPSLLMIKDGCPATLCKRWPTAPAFGGCRR